MLISACSSKRLESLERDARTFHESHNHMALEVTEYLSLSLRRQVTTFNLWI